MRSATARPPRTPAVFKAPRLLPTATRIPLLETGAHLGSTEFLRRYDAMPDLKKAELIEGVVYMGSPVSAVKHADPDALLQGWLAHYSVATPGVRASINPTICLSSDDTPQPDATLRMLSDFGGRTSINERGLIQGAPELVVEIAASSAPLDVHKKFDMYRRFGAPEYFVWLTETPAVKWWELFEDAYRPILADKRGILRSKIFPGFMAR